MTEELKKLFTIDELVALTGVSKRNIRYYLSLGVLEPPTGETRNARYDQGHLDEINNIKKLQAEGYTLSRIAELKQQSAKRLLKEKEPGVPITIVEIPVGEGVTISFTKDLCNFSGETMLSIAKKMIEYVNLEKEKQAETKRESD